MPKRSMNGPLKRIPQVGVIPFRMNTDGWEFCLVTSLKKKRWIFPKGIVDPGETPFESGLKEAWEEAGLRGVIVGPVVGWLSDQKWGAQLDVQMLMMHVAAVEADWPEAGARKRCWLGGREATERLDRDDMRRVLQVAREWLLNRTPSI